MVFLLLLLLYDFLLFLHNMMNDEMVLLLTFVFGRDVGGVAGQATVGPADREPQATSIAAK